LSKISKLYDAKQYSLKISLLIENLYPPSPLDKKNATEICNKIVVVFTLADILIPKGVNNLIQYFAILQSTFGFYKDDFLVAEGIFFRGDSPESGGRIVIEEFQK
jgi:putative uncharacterized protein (fragment)